MINEFVRINEVNKLKSHKSIYKNRDKHSQIISANACRLIYNQLRVDIMNSLTFITNQINNHGGSMVAAQLDLSNCNFIQITPIIKQLLESCPNLYQLKLNNCLLQSLDFMPVLNLQIIELSQNRLNDSQIDKLLLYPGLKQLSLKNNMIQSKDSLLPLVSLKNLDQLDLSGNPLCSSQNDYRKSIFQIFPSLTLIDNMLRNNEVLSEEEQNQEENNNFIFDKRYDSQEIDNEDEEIDYEEDPFEDDRDYDGEDNDYEFSNEFQDFSGEDMGRKKRKY